MSDTTTTTLTDPTEERGDTRLTAKEVAQDVTDVGWSSSGGYKLYRRHADGTYSGGQFYTSGSRPPMGPDDRMIYVLPPTVRFTAKDVEAYWRDPVWEG